jgi:hypothetical protein
MINQTLDHFATIGAVTAALLFAVRRGWRVFAAARVARQARCGPGCGCE